MKKQFYKIRIAAESLSRSTKSENKNDEVYKVEKHVDKLKEVLEKLLKKITPSASGEQEKEKRLKKTFHYKLGETFEESSKELPIEWPLQKVLIKCGEFEKSIGEYLVNSEIQTENEVVSKLKAILENDLQEITNSKRNFTRSLQEYKSLKRGYENANRLNENSAKLNQLQIELDQCELKLEKERDCWVSQMFELISRDDIIVESIKKYISIQKNFHETTLKNLDKTLYYLNEVANTSHIKRSFGISLKDHLKSTNREIAFAIELSVCSLLEYGLQEEGILRIGCAASKLKRMKNAIDAKCLNVPLPSEYQDIHVIASLLKLYLRELPEPILTYELYTDFIKAAQIKNPDDRKIEIKNIVQRLPTENYNNLRYITKFFEELCKNQCKNKMTSHNIAIVMSPNMLWAPEEISCSSDYALMAHSSSAVNCIVENLISDWNYFFDSVQVEFNLTVNRHNLFLESKNRELNVEENLDKSFEPSNGAIENIVSEVNKLDNIHESPKITTRRKHNKHSAPTPPNTEKVQKIIRNDLECKSSTIAEITNSDDSLDNLKPSNSNSSNKTLKPAIPKRPNIIPPITNKESVSDVKVNRNSKFSTNDTFAFEKETVIEPKLDLSPRSPKSEDMYRNQISPTSFKRPTDPAPPPPVNSKS